MARRRADIPAPEWAGKKAKKPRRKRRASTSDETEDVAEALDDATPDEPPPPPPPPARFVEPGRAAPAKMIDLGKPPSDLFAGAVWLGQLLLISAEECVNDADLAPSTRRKELRTIAASYRGLEDKIRKAEIEKLIRGERERLEQPATGATLEDVPDEEVTPSGAS